MSSVRYKPTGSVMLPALMCGVAASALAIGLDVMGYFDGVSGQLKVYFEGEPIYLVDPVLVGAGWSYAAAVVAGWLVSMAVLDTLGWWRRWLVGMMSFVVAVAFCPVLMLWGVFWSPMVLGVAVLWGFFCAMVYAGQHRMPCEVAAGLGAVKQIPDRDALAAESEALAVLSPLGEEDIKVETIPFPVPFKSDSEEKVSEGAEEDSERWQPKAGSGEN